MGKRQRDTGFLHLSDEEVSDLARDASLESTLRQRALTEEKNRKQRNLQKRLSRQRKPPKGSK